jgi:hypothetical protein
VIKKVLLAVGDILAIIGLVIVGIAEEVEARRKRKREKAEA